MQLLDTDQADALYAAMGSAREISGGSAANSMAGIAALGGKAAFVGQIADDQLGDIFSARHAGIGGPVRHAAIGGRAADRALPDPGHRGRPADDEHLSRARRTNCAPKRSTRR